MRRTVDGMPGRPPGRGSDSLHLLGSPLSKRGERNGWERQAGSFIRWHGRLGHEFIHGQDAGATSLCPVFIVIVIPSESRQSSFYHPHPNPLPSRKREPVFGLLPLRGGEFRLVGKGGGDFSPVSRAGVLSQRAVKKGVKPLESMRPGGATLAPERKMCCRGGRLPPCL
jgi:hypothetical protein